MKYFFVSSHKASKHNYIYNSSISWRSIMTNSLSSILSSTSIPSISIINYYYYIVLNLWAIVKFEDDTWCDLSNDVSIWHNTLILLFWTFVLRTCDEMSLHFYQRWSMADYPQRQPEPQSNVIGFPLSFLSLHDPKETLVRPWFTLAEQQSRGSWYTSSLPPNYQRHLKSRYWDDWAGIWH